MTRSRYRFREGIAPYFMTCTISAWLPVFSDPHCVTIVLDSWKFLQTNRRIDIFAWVILDNHLHWIASGPQLSRRCGDFKSFTAAAILNHLKTHCRGSLLQELEFYKLHGRVDQQYQVWQEGSHPQLIESSEVMEQKIDYIHNNPIRRGYVDDPAHWRYSSARSYAGRPGLIEVRKDWA
ncbi:MAG: transposase [Pirellulales bacterium]